MNAYIYIIQKELVMLEEIDAKESDYLYISKSGIEVAGKGLFTSIKIYKNEIISIYKGNILSKKEAALRAKNKLDMYFITLLDGKTMDSMDVNCFAKYANDAEGIAKTAFKNNAIITINDDDDEVCLVALRNLKAGEEIFCRYGKKYWRNFLKHKIS